MRIVVAMSGGVDSSTVAGLLVEQGHEVIGLAMKTHGLEPRGNRACCTPDDLRDARRVADALAIPFYVLGYEELFRRAVIEPFAQAYLAGQTPNPCVECNDKVKFEPLLARARLLGAERLATGHYARIERTAAGPRLLRGVDPKKDQSYFLHRLRAEQLELLEFPLGGMTKAQVRDHARRMGLPVAEKGESQEICFVGDEGYAATVERIAGQTGRPGELVTTDGKVLGLHPGVHHFTLGQRKGLGVAAAEPLYVTDIDPRSARVFLGTKDALAQTHVEATGWRWSEGTPPREGARLSLQQRYREAPVPVRFEPLNDDRARLWFDEPHACGAPGQSAVLYEGDRVVGGGTLVRHVEATETASEKAAEISTRAASTRVTP